MLTINGVSSNGVARWDGKTWHPLGSGIHGGLQSVFAVQSLVTWTQGDKDVLVAAGRFGSAGGKPAGGLAFWNGTDWEPAPGMDHIFNDIFMAVPTDLGDGPALYLSSYEKGLEQIPGRIFRYRPNEPLAPLPGIASPYNAGMWPILAHESPVGSQLVVGSPSSWPLLSSDILNAKNLAAYGCTCSDVSGDSLVTDSDLGLLLDGFTSQTPTGDIDNDGDTDDGDLGRLLDQFGEACP